MFAGPSGNANLSNLTLSSGSLSPTFSAGTTDYTASVVSGVTSVTVTPTAVDSGASIQVRVNGGSWSDVSSGSVSSALALNVGDNPIEVKVTAADTTTVKTYTVMVTKMSPLSSSLFLSSGTLSPVFNASQFLYTASVANSVISVTVTPTAADSGASIQVRVNGGFWSNVSSGSQSSALALNVGDNPIEVKVTAQDLTTKTYTVTVTRVAKITTTVDVTASLNPWVYGQSVTFTAAVTPTAALGTILFKSDGVTITGCAARPLSSGSATCETAALAAGSHVVTAEYSGDSVYTDSFGTLNTVAKAIPSIITWPTASTIILGQTLLSSTLTGGSGSVPGSFAWTNPATTPRGGYSYQGITFTPSDTTYNTTVTGSIQVPVSVPVTIATSPVGRRIRVDGVNYTAPQTFYWFPGTGYYSIQAFSDPNVGEGTQELFYSWSDDGTSPPLRFFIAPTTATTITATFNTYYQLTTNAGTGGTVLPATGTWYKAGMSSNIIATANSGYAFQGWSLGSGVGPITAVSDASTTIAMNGPNSVTAIFQPLTVFFSAALGAPTGATGGIRTWPVIFTNTGGATVSSVNLTGVTLSSSGACKPTATTVFPVTMGDIAAGGSATGNVTVDFSTCNSPKLKALKFSLSIGYSANGGSATGTLTLSGVGQ